MSNITFRVDGEPVPKGRPRFAMRGAKQRPIAYTPTKTRDYEKRIAACALEAMGDRPPVMGPLILSVTATLPLRPSWTKAETAAALAGELCQKPDVDNLFKIVADALNGVCYLDDCQIVEQFTRKHYGPAPGLLVVVRAFSSIIAPPG